MQFYNAWLKLGNDPNNTVPQHGISAAEIVMLDRIHGQGAVHDIEPTNYETRSARDEKGRLMDRFNPNVGDTMLEDPDAVSIVEKVFPGLNPSLPTTLDDLASWDESRFSYEARKRREREAAAADKKQPPLGDLKDVTVQSGPKKGRGRPPKNPKPDPAMPPVETADELTS